MTSHPATLSYTPHIPHPLLNPTSPVVLQASVYGGSLQAQSNRCQVVFHG